MLFLGHLSVYWDYVVVTADYHGEGDKLRALASRFSCQLGGSDCSDHLWNYWMHP